jgi:hypothetical protein
MALLAQSIPCWSWRARRAVLDIRGRDVESAELAIQFSKDTCRWTILGAAADIHQSDQRKKIIAVLIDSSEPLKVTELVAATGMKRNPLELHLGRMVKEGLIKRTGSGVYAHKDYLDEPPKPNGADNKAKSDAKGKSVRSVSSVPVSRQMRDGHQPADSAQESDGIYQSVRSVREFTSNADTAERVKSETDRTDRQIGAQATEERAKLITGDLSDPETDQTDNTQHAPCLTAEPPDDDLTIPPILDRRNEPPCAQCGRPGGTDCAYDGITTRLHAHERGSPPMRRAAVVRWPARGQAHDPPDVGRAGCRSA